MERFPSENQKRRKKSQSDNIHSDEMDEDDLALFHVVVEDLRVKSTVGWQNAVKSLATARKHLEREESQRFLEFAFAKIVGIMLDQHSNKIGNVEKGCVTDTLAEAVRLIAKQLENGRYAQVLPILVMVFNKKRTFYKDLRPSAMMGGYWNKVGGAPEVRTQCISLFCETDGFSRLLDTLEAIMKTMETATDDANGNENSTEKDDSPMDLLDSDDIRILLQALFEFRSAVQDTVVARLCTLIMTYFVRIPEPLLKRESTDAVGAVVTIVRRFVDINVIPAGAIDALWLELTLRYVQSSSLPLRLFALEQIGLIVKQARTFPPRYLVRNAGTAAVNGIYALKQDAGSATYVLRKEETGQVFTLFCCTMKSGLKWWFISEADAVQPGSDKDIDYYQHQSQYEEDLPPLNNWTPIGKGVAPAPELLRETVRDEEEVFDASRFDHIVGAWVVEKQITETIFGDRIHREVVSRSAPLIKFLADSNKLSEHALDTIWNSCLQKDRALVDEIHNLVITTVPFLSDRLLLRLVNQIGKTLQKRQQQHESIADLTSFLERLATAAPGFFSEKSRDVTNGVLRLLWSIQRIESRLSRSLRDFFQHGLRSAHGEPLRRMFLAECMDGIKRSCFLDESGSESTAVATTTASSSLELLKFLIDSYGIEMAAVIESLNREHQIVGLLFDELAAFVSRSRAKGVSITSGSHSTAIGHRLELIHYIHVKCPVLQLSVDQIQRLWTILSLSPVERECCFAFFNHASHNSARPDGSAADPSDTAMDSSTGKSVISVAFSAAVRRFIFDDLLCQRTEFAALGPLGYQCFHSFFLEVNADVLRDGDAASLTPTIIQSILGLDALWGIALGSPISVAKPASDELLRVYRGVCERGEPTTSAECVKDFLHRILTQLAAVVEPSPDALRRVQQSTLLLRGFVDSGHGPNQDEATASAAAASHGRAGRGAIFDVKVIAQRIPTAGGNGGASSTPENAFRTLHTTVYANMTLGQLRKQLEQVVGHPTQQTKILCAGAALTGDQKTVTDLRITEVSELRVLMFSNVVQQRPVSPDADQAMESPTASVGAPVPVGRLISQDAEYFEVLFRVLDVVAAHPAVHKALWDVLHKLPTDEQLLNKVTSMGISTAVTDDAIDGDTPMDSSPSSLTRPLSAIDTKAEWLTLLGESSENKPIYILQIVDSLLWPADSSKMAFAQTYKERFVAGGGFDAVLGYFLDADVRSSLFNEGAAVALRILRSCLFDSQMDEGADVTAMDLPRATTGERRVEVKQQDYVRLALKIADLIVAEYYPADHAGEHTTSESERILIDALKTVTSIVRIERLAADAYVKSESLGGNLMADILLKCANDQVREQWLRSLQAVCEVESSHGGGDTLCVVVIFERMIVSVEILEDISVPCDQYFRLLRFLVQEDHLADYCATLAREILKKLHSGFSAKFLASNERASEVITNCLEFLRDVLLHQEALRDGLAREMVEVVYDDCLFTLPTVDRRRGPLCVSTETRRPAFKLLATAISSNAPIIHDLRQRLARLFTRTESGHQQLRWGQDNSIETRRNGEHVGLKNQGCSCYMNSFLQQIFMHPTLRYGLLSAQVAPRSTPTEPTKMEAEAHPERLVGCRIALECMNGRLYEASVTGFDEVSRRHRLRYDDGNEVSFVLSEGRPGNENGRYVIMQTELTGLDATLEVLRQVQRTFCYLQDSEMRYFNPKALVDSCKCLNLEFSVYQQNDASEFCDKLLDRLETGLKSTPQGTKCLAHTLGGRLISQKLPQDCGHRYEREEPFIRLELQIRGKESIEESLASFVEGELMDGDNKVECELCGTKKAAVRRTCFGALPNFLVLHLKRFDLDYTTFETVKLNNRCAFPMQLNMKPYTKVGLEEEEMKKSKLQPTEGVAAAGDNDGDESKDAESMENDGNENDGDDVVMKDESAREEDEQASGEGDDGVQEADSAYEYRLKGILVHSGVAQGGHYYSFIYDHVSEKWFKYDDEDVSPFDPANIEAECFGGVQRRTWHGSGNSMEMEVFSNALMLFYEKIEPSETEYAESLIARAQQGMGSPYEAEVWRANEAFLQTSYVLDVEFHEFLREMVHAKYLKDQVPLPIESSLSTVASPSSLVGSTGSNEEVIQMTLASIGAEFVLGVLLHSREKHGIARWITVLASKFAKHKPACVQYFQALATPPRQIEWMRSILFESSDSIARQSFVHLTSRALTAYEVHMKTTSATAQDVALLTQFLDGILAVLDQTPVLQQTHLEECFMLLRNCADTSPTLRDAMRQRDVIARLVNCFLGERAPAPLKDAFRATHLYGTSNRYAAPDFQFLLEAIIAILGYARRSAEPLVNESNSHYPHRVTLSEKAESALTSVFEQYQSQERGSMDTDDVHRYLSACMSCSIMAPAVQQKAQGIMTKYGKQVDGSSPSTLATGPAAPTELELDGFLTYYTDAAAAAAKSVYQDLQAHGYSDDLKRHDETTESDAGGAGGSSGLDVLSPLSRAALLNDVFFDAALEEDAETVGDMLLRIVGGDHAASALLMCSLLQCMASTETGWKGQPVVDACSQMLQTLLARETEYQNEMVDMAMVHPDFGLLTTAVNRERVRQRYANSNLVPLFVYRQIVAIVELHAKIPAVASWLSTHKLKWEWMYEWLRLESLRPSLGGRLAVLYREPTKLEMLCRLGEAAGIAYREEERTYIVEGAGFEPVNGVYKSTSQLHDNCTIYTCTKEEIEFTLFRCSMPSKARRWYISYSPNRSLLGTVSDEDYYFVPCHIDDDAPPESGWRVWTKNEKAQPPSPTVRLFTSTVVSDNHATQQVASYTESGFSGDVECGDGDVDADADTVEYDDSEDEIRVSNERFQAVHLDNQDESDRALSPGTDDFM